MKIQILFQEDDMEIGETLEVTSLGDNLFRLENSPILSEGAHYGDVVEVAPRKDSWLFVRVAKPSDWNHFTHLVSQKLLQSQHFQLWLQSLEPRNAFWEVAYGGILFVSCPVDSPIDVEAELRALIAPSDR